MKSGITRQIEKSGQLFFGNMRYPSRGATLREKIAFNLDLKDIAEETLEQYLEMKFQEFHAELCLRKHPDWGQEKEWRCLFYSGDEEFKYINISKTLRGMVLGANFMIENWLAELELFRDRFGFPFLAMNWQSLTGRGFGSPQYYPPSKS
jgi:hypothetical protein